MSPTAPEYPQVSASPQTPIRIPILSPVLWQDPDVRWLTGVHESRGALLFVKESYEELLWWLQLPTLCKLAAESVPARGAIQEIGEAVSGAVEAAASAGYSLDASRERRAATPETATFCLAQAGSKREAESTSVETRRVNVANMHEVWRT